MHHEQGLQTTPTIVQGIAWLNNNTEIEEAGSSLLTGGWCQQQSVQAGLAGQTGMTHKRLWRDQQHAHLAEADYRHLSGTTQHLPLVQLC